MFEACTTEEQRSVVLFLCGQKGLMEGIFINKCFLFMVESVCSVKPSTTAWQTFRWWRRGWNGGAEVAETTVQNTSMLRVSTHWWSDGTSVSMLEEDMSRYKCFFFQVRISHVLRFMFICDLYTDSSSYKLRKCYWLDDREIGVRLQAGGGQEIFGFYTESRRSRANLHFRIFY
jgi:hypothetical protein